ncbi:MAG: hypothetical protein ACLPX5_08755 [Dissulfurispiraceae bacterium]
MGSRGQLIKPFTVKIRILEAHRDAWLQIMERSMTWQSIAHIDRFVGLAVRGIGQTGFRSSDGSAKDY